MEIRNMLSISLIIGLIFISNVANAKFSKDKPPTLEDYSITDIYKEKPKSVDISSHPEAKQFKTKLIEGAEKGPNFAGHYTVISIGCGTMCSALWIVDAKTGRIISRLQTELGEKYNINSKLLITNPKERVKESYGNEIPNWVETTYYIVKGNKMKKIFKIKTSKIIE